jgi:hypothetical protein
MGAGHSPADPGHAPRRHHGPRRPGRGRRLVQAPALRRSHDRRRRLSVIGQRESPAPAASWPRLVRWRAGREHRARHGASYWRGALIRDARSPLVGGACPCPFSEVGGPVAAGAAGPADGGLDVDAEQAGQYRGGQVGCPCGERGVAGLPGLDSVLAEPAGQGLGRDGPCGRPAGEQRAAAGVAGVRGGCVELGADEGGEPGREEDRDGIEPQARVGAVLLDVGVGEPGQARSSIRRRTANSTPRLSWEPPDSALIARSKSVGRVTPSFTWRSTGTSQRPGTAARSRVHGSSPPRSSSGGSPM